MEIREEMVRCINEVRRKCSVPELAVDQSLMDAAQECSSRLYTKHNNRVECETVAASGYPHGFGSNLTVFTVTAPDRIPKQAGLVAELEGQIVFEPEFRNPDALRGMEGFDYLWLI